MTLSGQIRVERVPFAPTVGEGLDFDAAFEAPARGIVVEIIDAGSGSVLASTTTSEVDGTYSVSVPASRQVFVRARARMQNGGAPPNWDFEVRDNTSGDALYVLDGSAFNTGTTAVTRDLTATTGWDASTASYTGPRSAAPFAILDTLYQAKELLVDARSDIDLGSLTVFWSESNRSSLEFCPDNGNIQTSLYWSGGQDDCPAGTISPSAIYLLGDVQVGDTDEFDQHVLAHEFSHYLENEVWRADSIGGEHSLADRLDLRVAFAEGWGNAFAAMVLDDPIYRDSFVDAQGQFDAAFDIETRSTNNRGWYSEVSVHEILWDVFDDAPDAGGVSQGETVALGFTPILDVLTSAHVTTDAFTSIYTFASALRAQNPAAAGAIDGLLADNEITGTSDFATGETNVPFDPDVLDPDVLPIYTSLALNAEPVTVCGIRDFGVYNKVSNRRFLSFSVPQERPYTITVFGLLGGDPQEPDPDFVVWREGEVIEIADSVSVPEVPGGPPKEQLDIVLAAGDYLLEVYEYTHAEPAGGIARRDRTCMTVSVTG